MTKQEIRKYIKSRKAQLTPEEIASYSEKVCRILLEQDIYKSADKIYPYIAYNQEIKTEKLIEQAWRDGKTVAVPKVIGEDMDFIVLNSFDQLKLGYCNIPEPQDGTVDSGGGNILMLMPGLAFDGAFNRIGYGGGFYDRYLEKNADKCIIKVAFAYDFQILEHIETELHDYKIDAYITSDGVYMSPTLDSLRRNNAFNA